MLIVKMTMILCVFNEPVDWKFNEKCWRGDGYWTAF